MSVIIKGVSVPQTCYKCRFSDWRFGAWYCAALQKHLGDVRKGRTNECPLVELPPHGDLIDMDALREDLLIGNCDECGMGGKAYTHHCWLDDRGEEVCIAIDNAPTVIPADV